MVNTEKVAIMTRAEIFRSKEKKGVLYVDMFYRSDYVSHGMLKATAAYIIAFVICAGMWIIYDSDALLTEYTVGMLFNTGLQIAITFVCLLVLYLVSAYYMLRDRYKKSEKRVREYQAILKKLDALYEKEKSRTLRIKE